jgi:hypothetical protein
VPLDYVDAGEGAFFLASQGDSLVAQRNLERLRHQPGSPDHQTIRTGVQIQACLRQKGSLPLKGHPSNHLFGVKPCLSGSGSRVEVLGVCESVNLRHSLVMKRVWSPDLQVRGELTWSRVRPNRGSCPGLIWIHYGQEMPKSPQKEQLEMDEASGVICFPLCAREEDPYLLPTALIPSVFVSV